eukprot:6476359-Amphidinium_carterae.2
MARVVLAALFLIWGQRQVRAFPSERTCSPFFLTGFAKNSSGGKLVFTSLKPFAFKSWVLFRDGSSATFALLGTRQNQTNACSDSAMSPHALKQSAMDSLFEVIVTRAASEAELSIKWITLRLDNFTVHV